MKNIILVLLAPLIFPEFQIQGQATLLYDEDTVSIVRDEGQIYGNLVIPTMKRNRLSHLSFRDPDPLTGMGTIP